MFESSNKVPELKNIDPSNLGDMPIEDFRKFGYQLIDWACDYFDSIDSIPVLPDVSPGDIKAALPDKAPERGEPCEDIIDDFKSKILPGVTHWNHPSFHAYFANTGSVPGIFGDLLSSVLNINGMLWKTCPSATELEEVVINWAKDLLYIPDEFFGMIIDTASLASLHALAAARENYDRFNIRVNGFQHEGDRPRFRLYCSDQAHSSIEKAAIVLGIGLENVCKIATDDQFRMRPEELNRCISEDKTNGFHPLAVVATLGTTSTTSIDPVKEISRVCRRHGLWLHVDGAYAGSASALPEYRWIMDGIENADSYVVNPHKWLFTPIDTSLIFVKDGDLLKKTFAVIPEYLKTPESEIAVDYMNYGIQLGRRFRSLKLWFVMRYFGKEGIVNRLRDHIRIARLFRSFVEESALFEPTAPTPFSVVCFRFNPGQGESELSETELKKLNKRLMNNVNATGKLYISHSMLKDKYSLRFAIGNIRTTENHIRASWEVITECAEKLM